MTDTANTTKSLNWNVIKTGGKQYIAKTGDKLRIEIEKQLEIINSLPQASLKKAFRGKI